MTVFDPNGPAQFEGIFGLPVDESAAARCVLIPVPFEATVSYRTGAADGPGAILAASRQVDLWDLDFGRVYAPGIRLSPESTLVRGWSDEARRSAQGVLSSGNVTGGHVDRARQEVNAACERLNGWVHARAQELLGQGRVVGVLGGDHSTAFGLMRAATEAWPELGILQVDAHADLREAYEGFSFSHASIMHNVLTRLEGVTRLVQVGLRDVCEAELETIRAHPTRVFAHFDAMLARERAAGTSFFSQVERILAPLPERVYVSFDIDGLDPALCPHTGTPVPGGLSFSEAVLLLVALGRSGRKIVAFDLCEVAPGPDDEWDGNVAARLLYKLIGAAFFSQGLL